MLVFRGCISFLLNQTPPKTNMERKNWWFDVPKRVRELSRLSITSSLGYIVFKNMAVLYLHFLLRKKPFLLPNKISPILHVCCFFFVVFELPYSWTGCFFGCSLAGLQDTKMWFSQRWGPSGPKGGGFCSRELEVAPPPSFWPYLLMVQKSQGQPPGMFLKPCK